MTYTRQSQSGHAVNWQPDDEQLADQAAQTIADNAEVGAIDDLREHNDKYAYDYLPREYYDALRDEYERLHVEKYGQDSQFYSETQ